MKRTCNGYALLGPSGFVIKLARSRMEAVWAHGDFGGRKTVRCTITYDEGKPVSRKKKRGA